MAGGEETDVAELLLGLDAAAPQITLGTRKLRCSDLVARQGPSVDGVTLLAHLNRGP